jgi:hypothetical protein
LVTQVMISFGHTCDDPTAGPQLMGQVHPLITIVNK